MVRIRSYSSRSRVRIAAILLGVALGVIMALWSGAPSRWLVRLQAHLAVPIRLADATTPELSPFAAGGSPTPESEAAFRMASEAMPDDAMAQVAFKMRAVNSVAPKPGEHNNLASLSPLAARFPRDPAVIAAVLRHAAGSNIRLRRPEMVGITKGLDTPKTKKLPTNGAHLTANAPDDFGEFDRLAATGERLDPRNAFFPVMRAFGLFAAGRDTEGQALLSKAAGLPDWNEYVSEEVRGAWRLGDQALGMGNTMVRAGILASITLSHYAELKEIARLATVQAIRLERGGKVQDGYLLRRDVLAMGAKLRAQSTTFIGASTGAAMQEIAASQPMGSPAPQGKNAAAKRRADFLLYLAAGGHEADIPWVCSQFEARDQMLRVESAGFDRFDITKGLTTFGQWVVAGLVFLNSALWVLFFGVLSALFSRLSNREAYRRPGLPWQAGVTAVLVFVSTLFWFLTTQLTTAPRMLLGAVAVTTLCVFVWLARTSGWRGLGRAVLVTVCALPVAALLAAMVLWLGRGFAAVDALLSPGVTAAYSARDTAPGLAALGLVVALVVAIGVAIPVWMRREPLGRGFFREYAAGALPVACALVVVYGGIAVRTVRMSVAINHSLEKMVQHEGRFYADLAGKQWPE